MTTVVMNKGERVQDPPIVQRLLNDPRAGWLWVLPRIWLGWQWFEAAQHKIADPAWVQTGDALKGFWTSAVLVPETGRAAITFDWYRAFLQMMLDAQAYTWFAKVVAYGEMLIGIALIIGAFTGIAAFFGGFMNWNFMMAGSASTNPLLDPLQDNGGPTFTHALLQGSPAIDAAHNAHCLSTDQRGQPRPHGTACDIGAYETDGTEPPASQFRVYLPLLTR